jgi:hypothetical protein
MNSVSYEKIAELNFKKRRIFFYFFSTKGSQLKKEARKTISVLPFKVASAKEDPSV